MNKGAATTVAIVVVGLTLAASAGADRSGELHLLVGRSSGAGAYGTLATQASHFDLDFDPTPQAGQAQPKRKVCKELQIDNFLHVEKKRMI